MGMGVMVRPTDMYPFVYLLIFHFSRCYLFSVEGAISIPCHDFAEPSEPGLKPNIPSSFILLGVCIPTVYSNVLRIIPSTDRKGWCGQEGLARVRRAVGRAGAGRNHWCK